MLRMSRIPMSASREAWHSFTVFFSSTTVWVFMNMETVQSGRQIVQLRGEHQSVRTLADDHAADGFIVIQQTQINGARFSRNRLLRRV